MLLRFAVSNHRSIMDEVELSMIAVDDRPSVKSFELLSESVLPVAGIYGPNASGKSNILDSLIWLSDAVRGSLRYWDEAIPREPFKFSTGPDEPSTYEIEMIVNGVRYAYSVRLNDSEIIFEGLYSYPERRRRILFERERMEINFRRGLGNLAGTRELLTPTTLALSAAMRLYDGEVRSFGRALAGIVTIGSYNRSRSFRCNRQPSFRLDGPHRYATGRMFLEEADASQPMLPTFDISSSGDNARANALALLRFADLGIDDVQVVEGQLTYPSRMSPELSSDVRKSLRMVHRVDNQRMPFDMEEESEGTRTWFRLIGPILQALRHGQILLFDELDASLHPRLSARIIDLFEDPVTNEHGAQLIFTAHDTSLLNHLNRDEVWLTEKASGATTLTALAEYGGDKVRRSLNIEKAYLQGRFGAVPELDQFLLRQALGLASADE